jgi:uncharacterized PurR-regulated membrane protein YhhQ (DUF165 family)
MQSDFVLLLGRMPYVTFFSIIAHYCAQVITLALSKFFAALMRQRFLFCTTFSALVLGQVADGIIFFGGAFGASQPVYVLLQMVVVSVTIKLLFIAVSSWLVRGAVWLKEHRYVSE